MKPNYNFEIDKQNKVIRFSDIEIKSFRMFKDAKDVLSFVSAWDLPFDGIPKNHYNKRARAFSDKYGITAAKFKTVVNAKMLEVWYDPIKEHANRFAFNNQKKLNPYTLAIIWECLPEIEQAKKDGIYNIVPWIIQKGKNPQELKEEFGKSVWKKLAHQSMTRNKLLAAGSKRFHYREENIQSALNLPSYILKRGAISRFQWNWTTEYLLKHGLLNGKHFKRSPENTRNQHRLVNTIQDTKRMAETLGRGFDVSWNPEKMKEKHEEYTHLIQLKKYSPEPYAHLKDFCVKSVEHNGYVATILDSAALVHEEGKVMHHCVGGYAEYVAQGKYIVYSVTKEGKRSSTIAFNCWDDSGVWKFNQHYGYCNAHIEDQDEKDIKNYILNLLNRVENRKVA